ncbi:MAG: death-on-curing family protein [Clostridiales bacterium GWC2_40_7]|nr:MAG: death-on-curing family protein [Clostridiales bacterium GWC2_40_7]
MRYLAEEELVLLNKLLIKKYSPHEISGVKFPDLLNSAVNRPKQSVLGEDAYKTIFEKATALFESLAQNHPFHSANKRVAFVGMVQFLRYNNYKFSMNPKAAEDFTLSVVVHKYGFNEITEIIKTHSMVL